MYPTPNERSSYSPAWPCYHFRFGWRSERLSRRLVILTTQPSQFHSIPGHYLPERHYPPHETRAPSFSFGIRTEYRQRDTRPAPNSYTIPVMIGPKTISMPSSPAYSLSARPTRGGFSEDLKRVRLEGTIQSTPALWTPRYYEHPAT